MAKQKKQKYSGIVYSTDSSFDYQESEWQTENETLANHQQNLRVLTDRKSRGGKVATLVTGFVGSAEDLTGLAKLLKQKCGVGGAAKDDQIIIQGDFKQRILEILLEQGYKAKISGG